MHHNLTLGRDLFYLISAGLKMYDIRAATEGHFQVNDIVRLLEVNPNSRFSGESVFAEITHIAYGDGERVQKGFVVLALRIMRPSDMQARQPQPEDRAQVVPGPGNRKFATLDDLRPSKPKKVPA